MEGTLSFGSLKMAFNGTHKDKNGGYFFEIDMDIYQLANNIILNNVSEYIDKLFESDGDIDIISDAKNKTADLFKTFLVQPQGASVIGSNVNVSNANTTPKRKRMTNFETVQQDKRKKRIEKIYKLMYGSNQVRMIQGSYSPHKRYKALLHRLLKLCSRNLKSNTDVLKIPTDFILVPWCKQITKFK